MIRFRALLLFLLSINLCTAQVQDINRTYWHYRQRLLDDFVRVGEGRGRSICATARVQDGRRNSLYYGDNTTYHGWYIGMLATEYALLKRNGESVTETRTELFYALRAVIRLDSIAETLYDSTNCMPGKASINGFFVRDDVSREQLKLFPGMEHVYSDYLLGYETYDRLHSDNEMSQDQAIHLLCGLRLVQQYVDDSATVHGIHIRKMAIETALRIIGYISHNKWIVINPVTGKKVYRGPDARMFSYAFLKAAYAFGGAEALKELPPMHVKSLIGWPVTKTALVPVFFNRTMILILATIGNAYGTPPLTNANLGLYDLYWQKQIFPLMHAEFYGLKHISSCRVNEKKIREMVYSADTIGNRSYASYGWNTTNRWLAPAHTYKSYDGFFTFKENTGLDWMVLHNLYRLRWKPAENKYFKMPEKLKTTMKSQLNLPRLY